MRLRVSKLLRFRHCPSLEASAVPLNSSPTGEAFLQVSQGHAMEHLSTLDKELHDLEATICEGNPCELLPNLLEEVRLPPKFPQRHGYDVRTWRLL
jgi:hypothetical protein